MGTIPRGIEVLVKKASVDRQFKQILFQKRSDAAKEIDLVLTPSETAILDSIPIEQIEKSILSAKIDPKHRLIFMGKVAALMLLTLSTVGAAGCVTGIKPEPVTGSRPDIIDVNSADETPQEKSSDKMQAPTGIRPDIPK